MFLSVVSPVYKAERIIPELVRRLNQSLSAITSEYEIILVEDGSPDNSWAEMLKQAEQDSKVKAIKLSRNFGQHHAITAGIDFAKGEWVVVMDCDLQDRPEEIADLLRKAQEGYDIVIAERNEKKHSFIKRLYSMLFYRLLSWLTGVKYDNKLASFGIYNRQVMDSLKGMRESIRCFPIMVQWVGFKKTSWIVQHDPRSIGKTSYNFRRLLNLALDIMLAYSDKPLRLTVKLGLIISLTSVLFSALNLYYYLKGEILVPGYATIIISIWLLSGLIIFILGIVGLYIGKIFEGVKNRPLYLVEKIVNE